MTPDDDYEVLAETGGCITYVRGLTPEQVILKLGGHPETFTSASFHDLYDTAPGPPGARLGITSIGDWTVIVEMNSELGLTGSVITRLSAGTRLVSHHCLDIKALDYFYWLEDGELRFCFIAQEGYMKPVPDELVPLMREIDTHYPDFTNPHDGPMFLLAEHLTGIKLTPSLLEQATYLSGVVPEPEEDFLAW
ncbi:hypothetical protein GCM10009733_039040 [Nonomuraea maheshkhaliensis]|uniref:SMI1/KNR4 family protein n=1 Tax=Nonomuraea maheshkhaliensis TaxID=419590 RepID=A0ABN2FAM1_9ACTN